MSGRKKILWLTSWYPNRLDAFDGDFIQRHARAAAIHHDIHVLFVKEDPAVHSTEIQVQRATGLTEEVIYIPAARGLFAGIKKQWHWKNSFQRAIDAYVVTWGKPDLVHVHVAWKAGLLGDWMKKKYGIPYLLSEHWGMYEKNLPANFYQKPFLVRKLIRHTFESADRVVTVSRYLADRIAAATGRKTDQIIPNVVDTTLFFHRAEKYSRFTFLHVSNMAPVKNAGAIINAFIQLHQSDPGPQLVMIGNRDDACPQMAAASGLLNQSIFFRGEISYTDVAEELRRSHCMVLFSDAETFSCVTAEALCCGVPVIVPATGALPELVNQENGMLVRVRDTDDLLQAMKQMLEAGGKFNHAGIAASAASKYGYAPVSAAFRELYDLYPAGK